MAPLAAITIGGRELDPALGGVLAVAIGLAIAGFGAYDYVEQNDAVENAVEVNATVTELNIDTVSNRRAAPDYKPEVTLEYSYQSETYTGGSVFPASISKDYDTKSAAESQLEGYAVGETTTAYVDPDAPGDAFLLKETTNAPLKFAGIGGFLMLLGGWSVFKRWVRGS
ncbi:DUF3592 domain-containing protein [Natronoarchaeum rubrum]|uniref:DUF3592 domain-containing protein n=1 Tax=Natronoarchaeum rubrum TaxID=755311 RepID=UPI00211246CC|nr:DUF3592 domain-containing protein [Natronoarchaeum rubrum]HMB49920.1 DUF3592 domain-containing protein [Natronoarchaeum rubrum]